jgi:hypothetical protein
VYRLRQLLLGVLIFIGMGELVVQVDNLFAFFQGNRFVQVDNSLRESSELQRITSGRFTFSPGDLRILVLGDSRIRGLGIKPGDVFSRQLKLLLQADKDKPYANVYVLDVSAGGYNTLMNKRAYFKYVDLFKPQLVILCYNYDDVNGNQDDIPADNAGAGTAGGAAPAGAAVAKHGQPQTQLIPRLLEVLYNLKLVKFILVNANMELKLHGIILPGSEFYHVIHSYSERLSGWVKSSRHLEEIIRDSRQRGIKIIVYTTPELNMLANYGVFDPIEKELSVFFKNYPGIYVNGVEPFAGRNSDDFALSRYDAHPNTRAHRIMAEHVYRVIKKTL